MKGAGASERLRIVIASETFFPFVKGGAEHRFYEIGKRLAAAGNEVHWFAARGWDDTRNRRMLDGMELHVAGAPKLLYQADGRRAGAPVLRQGLDLALAFMRERRLIASADIIDCGLYPFLHCFAARTLFPRVPLIISWYEFWGDYWVEYSRMLGPVGRAIERRTASLDAGLVPVSTMAMDGLRSAGVPDRRLTLIENGVDTARAAAIRPSAASADLVYFGRLKNHKNVDLLIRALHLLRRTRPELTLLVIGSGPEEERLKALTRELGLEAVITFAGRVESDDELIARVKACKVFVHPSTKEGGGSITLVEANACGLPAVAVRHPLGIDPSLIESGRNGYWAEAPSPESIAAAVQRCLRDDATLATLRRSSLSFAAQFDWGRIADRMLGAYRAEIARRGVAPS